MSLIQAIPSSLTSAVAFATQTPSSMKNSNRDQGVRNPAVESCRRKGISSLSISSGRLELPPPIDMRCDKFATGPQCVSTQRSKKPLSSRQPIC